VSKSVEAHIHRRPWSNDVAVYLASFEGGKRLLGTSVVMEAQEVEGMFQPEPTFRMTPEEAQMLANRLWDEGFRPHQATKTGADAAQSRHLEDMRSLAFAKLGIEKPQ
jgi:hypothetical protein